MKKGYYLATLATLLPSAPIMANEVNERLDALEAQLNATAEMVENSAKSSAAANTHLGGYGELHYNKNKDAKDEIDFHRFVLFISHSYNDRISFHSELELEHSIAGEGKAGEIELEQAYIDIKYSDNLVGRAGLFLMPIGILNETHEPDTFYGVERNPVEKNIIPATWWEGGAGVNGALAEGVTYDVYVHSGLNTGGKKYKPRDGRQKVGKAQADDHAITARIKYTAVPGLEVAGSYQFQSDITQGNDSKAGSASLFEGHVVYTQAGFGLRALYASWMLSGDGPKASGADKQSGFYIEPSYKFMTQYGVFARYSEWNNAAGSKGGDATTQTDFGLNYWPHPKVVAKIDYSIQGGAGDSEALNLGLGYQF